MGKGKSYLTSGSMHNAKRYKPAKVKDRQNRKKIKKQIKSELPKR